MTSPQPPMDLLHGELARALGVRALPYVERAAPALGSGPAGAGSQFFWKAGSEPRAFALRGSALAAEPGPLEGWESVVDEPMEVAGWTRVVLAASELTQRSASQEPIAQVLEAVWDAATVPAPTPRLMGVVNVTPDSFSDGGRFLDPSAAIAHGLDLEAQGASFLDIGGESTRPGAQPVPVEVELARVLPVIAGLAGQTRAVLSIDTSKAVVAEAAIGAGATMVNDISAGLGDPAMLACVARHGALFVAMHRQGSPAEMQADPRYSDPVAEICDHLRERLDACRTAGISAEHVWLDPGIGFGKRLDHNLALLRRLPELRSLGCPLLLGVSRKSFIGHITGAERQEEWQSSANGAQASAGTQASPSPPDRLGGTAAAIFACVAGGADILRVHDVAPMAEAAAVAHALTHSLQP